MIRKNPSPHRWSIVLAVEEEPAKSGASDEAFTLASSLPGWIVLLAAAPEKPETGRVWIRPGAAISARRPT